MRKLLFTALCVLSVGCVAGPTGAPAPAQQPEQVPMEDQEHTAGTGAGDLEPALMAQPVEGESGNAFSPTPVQAHRARRFYLQGVRLLYDPARVDEAIREFKLSLEMDPRFYKAHFKLGICYYHKGQYELEITEYKLALAINRNYSPAWLNLGHAFLARDELELARDAYREVLNLSADNPVALYNLGLVEFDLRQLDQASEHLQRFLELEGSGEMREKAKQYLDEIESRQKESSK